MLALSQGEEDAAHLLLAKGADPSFNVAPGFSYTAVTKFNWLEVTRRERCDDPLMAALAGEAHP